MSIERHFHAYLDQLQMITILLPYSYHGGNSSSFYLASDENKTPLTIEDVHKHPQFVKYICFAPFKLAIGEIYYIHDQYDGKTDLQIGAVIRTQEFDEKFFYEGKDLGMTVLENKIIFKVWAPTATNVKLKLINKREKENVWTMQRQEKGVWSIELDRSVEGSRYFFLARINLEWREAVDPYARAVSENGKAGVVIDLEKTKMAKVNLPSISNPCDAIIYETHIRDLTIHPHSGVKKKGTYLGASELGTVSRSGEVTGLSYIKDLGVTHIEFLPFNDFAGVDELAPSLAYNWGYNPIHYNVPEGSYSTNPRDPYKRITELKKLIETIHSEGLRVIMDVVYNHVYIREESPFEQLVPGYYFRHDEHGFPSNGTGVGNDFASERLMARKFILDSVEYWMKEYQIDGLRFDLMGILDIETMQKISDIVYEINPSAIIIGEGWDLNTPIPISEKASIRNQQKIPSIGQFNDWFRDTIKGSTFNLYDKGYVLGNERTTEAAKQVIAGSISINKRKGGLFTEPHQSVNYVECHDNHTLWDKLSSYDVVDYIKKRHRLATSMVILSQGIPFLHSGQEFFRTKAGIGNSYQSSDEINWLDWDRRDRYIENVNYIKGIISIRKSYKPFRLSSSNLIRKHMSFLSMPQPMIGYMLSNVREYGEWDKIIVYFNPTATERMVELPEESKWTVLANHKQASALPVDCFLGQKAKIMPCSLLIVVK
nr:type I pullulanase [Bacillus sp. B15-48]